MERHSSLLRYCNFSILPVSSPASGCQNTTNGQEYFLFITSLLVGCIALPGTSQSTIIQDFFCTAAIHLPVTNCTWATQELQLNQQRIATCLFHGKGKTDDNTLHWGFLLCIGTTWTHLKALTLILKGSRSKLLTDS